MERHLSRSAQVWVCFLLAMLACLSAPFGTARGDAGVHPSIRLRGHEIRGPLDRAGLPDALLSSPADLERDYGMKGGHWHHGELSLDQVMMTRPFPGATQYASGLDGLYLCSAGTHPGGGVMGLAGKNAAREIIRRGAGA